MGGSHTASTGLFALALVYLLYVAQPVVLPIVISLLLSILLQPIINFLQRIAVPRLLAAALTLLVATSLVAAGVYSLSAPGIDWMAKAPQAIRELEYKFYDFKKPAEHVSQVTKALEDLARLDTADHVEKVAVDEPGLEEAFFSHTAGVLSISAVIVVLVFFLLASRTSFLEKLLKAFLFSRGEACAVDTACAIQMQISRYLFTITVINIGLGAMIGLAMYVLGMPNPILWGVAAGLLNYVPYVGNLVGLSMVTLVAVMSFDSLARILLVPACYWLLTALEGFFITPMVHSKRFTIHPVTVVRGVIVSWWMWG